MSEIHECKERGDSEVLYGPLALYLKPIARINITIHYPQLKQTVLPAGGKSVSSWELMEKLKALVDPQKFISIKIVKNTLEFIRFEGDLETRDDLKQVLARLEGKKLKITAFKEPLKILVAETKVIFPSKYDWDTFFRDSKHMNEMRPGERPDTIHFQNIPSKWFSANKTIKNPPPSEKLFLRVFEKFGEIRHVDIPVLDPYRSQMNAMFSGIKTFTFNQDPVFEAYIQYKDYMSFVKAMDALRGMFLMHQEKERLLVANIKVNFDKTKHLTEESIKKRKLERERLIQKERTSEFNKHKLEMEKEAKEEEEAEKQRMLEHKIVEEEKLYLVARRKLESIRLMDYLMEQLKVEVEENGGIDSDSDNKSQSLSDLSHQSRSRTRSRARSRNRSRSPSRSRFRRSRNHSRSVSRSRAHSRNHSRSHSRHHSRSHSRSDGDRRRKRHHYDKDDGRNKRVRGDRGVSDQESEKSEEESIKHVVKVPENEDEAIDFYQRNSAQYYRDKRIPNNKTYYTRGDDQRYHPEAGRGARVDSSLHPRTIHVNPNFHNFPPVQPKPYQFYNARKRYNNYQTPSSLSSGGNWHVNPAAFGRSSSRDGGGGGYDRYGRGGGGYDRGRGEYRGGGGRGNFNHYQQRQRHGGGYYQSHHGGRDGDHVSYNDELDRAYDKYFRSLALKGDKSTNEEEEGGGGRGGGGEEKNDDGRQNNEPKR